LSVGINCCTEHLRPYESGRSPHLGGSCHWVGSFNRDTPASGTVSVHVARCGCVLSHFRVRVLFSYATPHMVIWLEGLLPPPIGWLERYFRKQILL